MGLGKPGVVGQLIRLRDDLDRPAFSGISSPASWRQPVKWIVFIPAVLGVYPFGCWLRARPQWQFRVWTLLGFLPFFSPLDIGIISDRYHPGDSHGIEVALIDLLVLSLFVAQPPSTRPLPYRAPMAAYLLAAVLSITQAPSTMAASFYVWKLLRMYFLFFVLLRAREKAQVPTAVVRGMTFGILYEFILALWQRYGLGVHQVPGSFAHQNTLGVVLNLVLMVPVSLVLARRSNWLTTLAPILGMVTLVLTLSRGALVFFLLGFILVYLASLLRGLTTRKMAVAMLGVLVVVAVFTKAAHTLSVRFETAPAASIDERKRFETAASMMLQQNPLGVGVNHFAWELMNRGYGDRAGVDIVNRGAIVHNIYWLTAAEMGYFGIVTFIALLLIPMILAFRYGLRARADIRSDVLLGLGVGLALLYLHGTFEWVWRLTEVSYLFWMIVAIVAVLVRQLRDSRTMPMIAKVTTGAVGHGSRPPHLAPLNRRPPLPVAARSLACPPQHHSP